jgi:hypothetical protein
MFNPIQFYEFGKIRGVLPNTFIGGVSAILGTAQLLATKLAIDVSRITNFSVVGSDIKCKISGSYVIPNGSFYFDNTITYYNDLYGIVTDIGSGAFRDDLNSKMRVTKLNFPKILNLTSTSTIILGSPVSDIYLDDCLSIGNSSFASQLPFNIKRLVYIPKCTSLGSTTANNFVFENSLLPNSVIICHPSLATNNGGNVDGDIQDAINQGAEIRYKINTTVPNAVNDLSIIQTNDKSFKLSFSVPSSVNNVDYYECYANGILQNIIKGSGGYINNLSKNTDYLITVIAIDVFMNISLVSNVVSQKTANTSVLTLQEKAIVAYPLSDNLDLVNGFNNSIGSAVSFSAGKNGNAANFVATNVNSKITIPWSEKLAFNNGNNDLPFSISTWVKYNASGNYTIIQKGRTDRLFEIVGASNILYFRLSSKANLNNRIEISKSFVPTNGVWYNLIFTYSGNSSNTGLNMYINGVLQTVTRSNFGTAYLGLSTNPEPIYLGKLNPATTFNLQGSLDEFYIFNSELTQSEVTTLQTNFYPF